ncbi:MAG: sulfatase-like hydrolase/transferase [Akkermansiaceae bacterium]|jgi:arylsulfatase A-like enzyme|nr:sulfatase-like hydrolase/transferase [Akkermansiaceae bacterium]MDP4720406.1 sulfatase-like hydrolase/transferase [Akkermansiaceae bacterium]MDP4779200.1 sulfatase-like hydrolase/transferase [Akkermansiaceae bacterium]MDP4898546.1 sulfatase-like hydrolase/transferase [Akkermansiaceae bacterium]MDP4995243.1 sulfatase-like hydrolase/transferase [Akkermansiaceae bacterium]
MKFIYLNIAALFTFAFAAAAEKPNIVFIFSDDWGWGDLSCHGHPYVKTPNIDRLAKEGTDFHRFTVASGVCSPSRAAVMTGHFPARYNIDGHFAWVENNEQRNMPDWLPTSATTIPKLLKSVGYATAHYGKWHLANNMITDSPTPAEYGYDDYGAFNCSGLQMPFYEDSMRAISFMEKSKEEGKPFFINLWVHEPHSPHHVIPEYQWRFRDLEEKDNIYASVLSHADDRIGEVLDALDRLGLTENTLVIFSSDNGPAPTSKELTTMYDSATGVGFGTGASMGITGGRKGAKHTLYEGGICVPFLARWPGKIAAGGVDDKSMISAVDLLPTFCELAGAELPDAYEPDGLSQVAALKGNAKVGREKPLFWKLNDHWLEKPNKSKAPSYAVVSGDWKLLSSADASVVELHQSSTDPYDKTDVSAANPEVVEDLLKKIVDWKKTLPTSPGEATFSSLRGKE